MYRQSLKGPNIAFACRMFPTPMALRLSLLVLLTAVGASARAEHPLTIEPTDPRHEMVIDLKYELPVLLVGGTILGGSQVLGAYYGPSTCRWCDTPSSLNAFDAAGRRAFAGADRAKAGLGSDLLAYAGMPLLTLGLDLAASLDTTRGMRGKYRARRFGIDVLLMTEAMTTTLTVMQLSKFATQRRRPSAIDEPTDGTRTVDQNLSFFSGHTALAFSLATSAGTIASLRHERLAPVVWAVGVAAATATGMSRVAADQHFASDVIIGSLVGSAIGILVPVLHRYRTPVRVGGQASATAGLISVSGNL